MVGRFDPKMHLSDSDWTIIKIVEQMDIDRRHTQKLQDTIETMRVSQLQHMADLLTIDKSSHHLLMETAATRRNSQ